MLLIQDTMKSKQIEFDIIYYKILSSRTVRLLCFVIILKLVCIITFPIFIEIYLFTLEIRFS